MHPHEHTTHALRDVIEALPRYVMSRDETGVQVTIDPNGNWLRRSDVIAVVHKAATLGAPIMENLPLE